jgi:hypothetical protein
MSNSLAVYRQLAIPYETVERKAGARTEGSGKQMPVRYVTVEEAMPRDGLRMVVVGGVPSPWGEAAKGILHIKGIDWVAVRLVYDSEPLLQWTGQRSGVKPSVRGRSSCCKC